MDPLTPQEQEAISSLQGVEIMVFCRLGRGHDTATIGVLIGETTDAILQAKAKLYEKLDLINEPDERKRESAAAKLCDRHYEHYAHIIGNRRKGKGDSYMLSLHSERITWKLTTHRRDGTLRRASRESKPKLPQPVFPEEPLQNDSAAQAIAAMTERQRLLIWLAWKGLENEDIATKYGVLKFKIDREFGEIYGLLGYRKLGGRIKRPMLTEVYVRFRELHPEIVDPSTT